MALSRLIAGLAAAAFACTASVPGATQTPPAARAHAAVSTSDPAAQASFDRGLAMLYAFSVGEARLSFEKAAASDPHLAMARWGEALADTIDINLPQTADGDKRGALAIAEARRTEDGATPLERALIDALAQRYIARGTVARRFRWYSDAMNRVATSYPNDPNVLTLAAYAEWNALDNLVLDSGAPSEGGARMARELDRALELDPDNIGAHHLRIHVQEVLGHPDRALADARYFDGLSFDLGMSHLPHMAGHIYDRLGDYPALVAANRRAVANDDAYFALGSGAGQLYMRDYHNHDLEFILYGLTTQGLDAEASAALANESANEKLRLALRLHDNARVLALADASPATPAALRAIALARSGRTTEAAALLKPAAGSTFEKARTAIAGAVVARAQGRFDDAAASYRSALKLLGGDLGDPKNFWFIPPGEGLGAVLLDAGRTADAEAVFRSELGRFPNDPRLAFGLAEALTAQGKDAAAERAIIEREWKAARPLTRADLG
jgi:tetratricopeptide (TPR) repeat protein